MNYEAMPIIRLEIDRLKQTIQSMLGTRGSELGDMINKSIDKALTDYDIDSVVRGVVTEAVETQIKRYFEYGEGRKTIEEMIKIAFQKPIK